MVDLGNLLIGLWVEFTRFPGGKVRVVRVITGGKDYVRPITNLCPLEI